MKIGLIGMSGTGKTTLLDAINNNTVVKLPEVARTYLSQSKMFETGGYALNIQSICIANWNNISIMNANPTLNFIADRTIVDDFALMHLYFKKEIDFKIVQENIDSINKNNKSEFLYDTLIVIKNSEDKEFIVNNILTDEQRKNSKSYEGYISNAKSFYELTTTFLNSFTGVARNVIYREFAVLTTTEIDFLLS